MTIRLSAALSRTKHRPSIGGLLALSLAFGCADAPPARPNLLVVVVDTLRADRLGAYGHTRSSSPSIDRLAADAALFERAYSAAPWTKPAVASLLTGLHPRSHTAYRMINRLPESVDTLAEILAANRYATAAVVSHVLIGALQRFDQGFEGFHEDEARGHRHVSTEGVTKRALELLETLGDDPRPFFLLVHYFDPHFDYMPHPEYGFAASQAGRLRAGQTLKRAKDLDPPATDEEVAFLQDLYDEEVRLTDDGIGRLLDWLRQRGLYDETLIAVTADHGEEFFDHGCLGHTRTLYDELVRVPLVVREPGRGGGAKRVAAPVSLVSLTPTLLELLGVDAAGRQFEEPSIAGLVWGDADEDPVARAVFSEVDFRPDGSVVHRCPPTRADLRAVVRGRHKLIHDRLTDRYELYDLQSDPGEHEDLSARDPDLLAALRAELDGPRATVGSHEREARAPDPDVLERLRDLGYLEQ